MTNKRAQSFLFLLTLLVVSSFSLFGQEEENPLPSICPPPTSISFEAFNETSLEFQWDGVPLITDYEVNVYLNGNLILNTLTPQTSVIVTLSAPFVDEDEFEIAVQSVCPNPPLLLPNSINNDITLTPIGSPVNANPSLLDAVQEISPLPIYWLNNMVTSSPLLAAIDTPLPTYSELGNPVKKMILVEFVSEPIATVAIVYGMLNKPNCGSLCSDWARFSLFGNYFYSISDFCEKDILRISQAGDPNNCYPSPSVSSLKTSLDETLTKPINFSPNPFKDYLVFEYLEKEITDVELNIFNSMGQLIESVYIDNFQGNHTLDLSHLQPGLYHYQLNYNDLNKVQLGKLVKLR